MGARIRYTWLVTALFCFTASSISGSHRWSNIASFYPQREEQKTSDQTEGWTFCFENKCRCKDDLADCSQNHGDLTFIPRLPERVKFVNFSFNSVARLSDNFFTNVTNITSFDISDSGLILIGTNAFQLLRNLTQLFISNNPELRYATLDPVFSLSTLEELDIAGGNLGTLPADFFHKYPLANLEVWNLHNNHLLLGDLTEFSALKSLSDLDLSYNDIREMKTGAVLDLWRINLEKNALFQFPQTCRNKASLFPQLTHLILRQNRIASLVKEICLPSLMHLEMSQNFIAMLMMNGFNTFLFPNLRELYLNSMVTGVVRMESLAFNNPSLAVLCLSTNKLDFDVNDVDPDSFQGCPSLRTLVIDGNVFRMADKGKTRRMFRTVRNLTHLDLRNLGITSVSNDTFEELSRLRQLFLSNNSIQNIPDNTFDGLLNLTLLDLSYNHISVIQENAFSVVTRGRLQHLDLSGNPFTCSCELRWFQAWLNGDPALFNNSNSNYTCCCVNSDIEGGQPFSLSDQACIFSTQTYNYILIGITFTMIALFLVLYFLRNRWRMRKVIRRALGGNNDYQQLPDIGNYEYDLFVAYAEGDEDWVHGWLTLELEERMGLRLCLHQRDFHPGRHILDNIESCVNVSRKVMMVFSPHFARSQWCQFELTLCQRHVMDRGDYLVVVYLHDVPERDLTAGMMAILRTYTYLQWSEEPGVAAYFWNNLRLALDDVIH